MGLKSLTSFSLTASMARVGPWTLPMLITFLWPPDEMARMSALLRLMPQIQSIMWRVSPASK